MLLQPMSLFFAYLLLVFDLWLPLGLYITSSVYISVYYVDGCLSLNTFLFLFVLGIWCHILHPFIL